MKGDQTIRVTVANPIPVLIVYGTAVVMEDGEVRFFDDIYGGDVALEQALAKAAIHMRREPKFPVAKQMRDQLPVANTPTST